MIELVVEGVLSDPKLELRERIEEFARLRNYRFNEFKEHFQDIKEHS